KWHLGELPEYLPQQRGFDEFFGFLPAAHTYFPVTRESGLYRGTTRVQVTEYLTDAIAREAINFIDRHRQQPSFLYVAFNAVHEPLDATSDKLKQFETIQDSRRRSYACLLSSLDDAIGRIVARLRATELENDTLIFFLSDNGGPTMPTIPNNGASNAPLRGSK